MLQAPLGRLSCLLVIALCSARCTSKATDNPPPKPPEFRTILPLDQLMEATIAPMSQVIFDAAVYNNGVLEMSPKTDEEWEHVEHSALGLAESANLLLLPGRPMPGEEWTRWTHALADAALVAAKAAESKNVDAVLDAGGRVYDTCMGCHARYLVQAEQARNQKVKGQRSKVKSQK